MADNQMTPRMRHALGATSFLFPAGVVPPGFQEHAVIALAKAGVDFDRQPFAFDEGLDRDAVARDIYDRLLADASGSPALAESLLSDEKDSLRRISENLSVCMRAIGGLMTATPLVDHDLTPRKGEIAFIAEEQPQGGLLISFASDAPLQDKRRLVGHIREGGIEEFRGRDDISFDLYGGFTGETAALKSLAVMHFSETAEGRPLVRYGLSLKGTDWDVLNEQERAAYYSNTGEITRLCDDFESISGVEVSDARLHDSGALYPGYYQSLFTLSSGGETLLVATPSLFDGSTIIVADKDKLPERLLEFVDNVRKGRMPFKDFMSRCAEECLDRGNIRLAMEAAAGLEKTVGDGGLSAQEGQDAELGADVEIFVEQSGEEQEAAWSAEPEPSAATPLPDEEKEEEREEREENKDEEQETVKRFSFDSSEGLTLSDRDMEKVVALCGRASRELAVKGGISPKDSGWNRLLESSGALVPVVRRDIFGHMKSVAMKDKVKNNVIGYIERVNTSHGREWKGQGAFLGCTSAEDVSMMVKSLVFDPANLLLVRSGAVDRIAGQDPELFRNWEKINGIVAGDGTVTMCLQRPGKHDRDGKELCPYHESESKLALHRALKGRGEVAFGEYAIDKAVTASRLRADESWDRMRDARTEGRKVWRQREPDSMVVFLVAEKGGEGHEVAFLKSVETVDRSNRVKEFTELQKSFGELRRKFEEKVREQLGPDAARLDLSDVQWKDAVAPYATPYCVGFRRNGDDLSFRALSPAGEINELSFTGESYSMLQERTLSVENVRNAAGAILEVGVEKFVRRERYMSQGHKEEMKTEKAQTFERRAGYDKGRRSGGFAQEEDESVGWTI